VCYIYVCLYARILHIHLHLGRCDHNQRGVRCMINIRPSQVVELCTVNIYAYTQRDMRTHIKNLRSHSVPCVAWLASPCPQTWQEYVYMCVQTKQIQACICRQRECESTTRLYCSYFAGFLAILEQRPLTAVSPESLPM
jgi:hypothetical protein